MAELEDAAAVEESESGEDIAALSAPAVCSCNDSSKDCISLASDEKALPDDTVLDVELLPVLDVELLP
ncbi:hypothetical protein [Pleomorphomonas sp. PLEO]|uniref:hypothetical protein n=1 Tax=Pleomorphomonas sp. PLEO TaxID=3239306 RepID=UPI00351F4ABF